MLPPPIHLPLETARRFHLRAVRLDRPHESVAAALAHHGYVQIDPINVCGRMHDLNLRNRVAGYREGDLIRHLHGSDETRIVDPTARIAFEHYLAGRGILVAFPIGAWPHVAGLMRDGRLRKGFFGQPLSRADEKLAERILGEIRERGALTSSDIEHEESSMTAWGVPGRHVKNVLEVLFSEGRVLIAGRRGFRRVYDLPERVLPASILGQAAPPADETNRWLIELGLRQRRLVTLSRRDLPFAEDLVQPVKVEDCPALFCLRADTSLLEEAAGEPGRDGAVRLLAPLDPLIYDRDVTRRLWDFDYTWEVYTPAPKRMRGYYALPVLAEARIAGHVEPRADRATRRLTVVSRRVKRGVSTAAAVAELAAFLGLRA